MEILSKMLLILLAFTYLTYISTEDVRYTHPILINERSLIKDSSDLIRFNKRYDVVTNLIDTTYDSVGDILLLDINMLFEENLQYQIENSKFFIEQAKEISNIIQKSDIIESIKMLDPEDKKLTLRTQRLNWIAEYFWKDLEKYIEEEFSHDPKNAFTLKAKNLEDLKHKINDETYMKDRGNSIYKLEKVLKGKALGYLSLIKMLWTQYPYFGGSVEYMEGHQDLEFWMYHFSTLTRDPDRNYLYSPNSTYGQSSLPKKMMDYQTYKGMLIPSYNQRNLGLGIDNISWELTPQSLKTWIIRAFDELGKQKLIIDKLLYLTDKQKEYKIRLDLLDNIFNFVPLKQNKDEDIETLWNQALKQNKLQILNDDVIKIDWFKSQVKNQQEPIKERLIDIETFLTTETIAMNVVGVRKNVLILPEEARKLLEKDLETAFYGYHVVPRNTFVGVSDEEHPFSYYGNELKEKHTQWFIKVKQSNKPIIGGISGHTLGYLNIYKAAMEKIISSQEDVNAQGSIKGILLKDLPSLEIMRTIMLGGLIGNKRHHSYDEVMSASHKMPNPHPSTDEKTTMSYKFPFNYADMFSSSIPEIKHLAEVAWHETVKNVRQPHRHSVLKLLYNMILYKKESEKTILQNYLMKYLELTRLEDKELEIQDVKSKVIEYVNYLIKEYQEQNIYKENLKFLS